MRIVHIGLASLPPVLSRYGGAVQRRMWELAREQVRVGHDVLLYSVGYKTERLWMEGVELRYVRCRMPSPINQLEFQIRVIRDLTAQRQPWDVLHFHGQPEGAWLSKSVGGLKVLTYDNFYFRRARIKPVHAIYEKLLKQFDLLLPCSRYCLEESRRFWNLGVENTRVMYNGVNRRQFFPSTESRNAERQALGIDDRVLLYVGRVCRQKGSDLLLDAFHRLRGRRNGVRLVFAGPVAQFGNTRDAEGWARMIDSAGATYLGAVAEERLASLYNWADIFVMPTRELEMFGMAAVEAQACGKPVVASDHGGLRETVPEECGGRFKAGDATDLTDKLEGLLDHDEFYRSASENALRNAALFDWQVIVEQLSGMYEEAMTLVPRELRCAF